MDESSKTKHRRQNSSRVHRYNASLTFVLKFDHHIFDLYIPTTCFKTHTSVKPRLTKPHTKSRKRWWRNQQSMCVKFVRLWYHCCLSALQIETPPLFSGILCWPWIIWIQKMKNKMILSEKWTYLYATPSVTKIKRLYKSLFMKHMRNKTSTQNTTYSTRQNHLVVKC